MAAIVRIDGALERLEGKNYREKFTQIKSFCKHGISLEKFSHLVSCVCEKKNGAKT